MSNTHDLEIRTWPTTPLAVCFDAVCFSHELGVLKPAASSYAAVLHQLSAEPTRSVYVGDGSGGELKGAKAAGFGLVVLVRKAAERHAPHQLSALRHEADITIGDVGSLDAVLGRYM